MTLYRATIETRNFSFEAFGGTHNEAADSLLEGLKRHAKTYKIPLSWWHEFAQNVEVRSIKIGACYRDRDVI